MHRKHSSVPLDRGRPGWMLGVFQLFDFHQRFYVRKALPDKKHEGERQDEGTKNPGAAGEGHDFNDGKVDSRLVSSCVTDLMHALDVQPIQTCSVLIDKSVSQ